MKHSFQKNPKLYFQRRFKLMDQQEQLCLTQPPDIVQPRKEIMDRPSIERVTLIDFKTPQKQIDKYSKYIASEVSSMKKIPKSPKYIGLIGSSSINNQINKSEDQTNLINQSRKISVRQDFTANVYSYSQQEKAYVSKVKRSVEKITSKFPAIKIRLQRLIEISPQHSLFPLGWVANSNKNIQFYKKKIKSRNINFHDLSEQMVRQVRDLSLRQYYGEDTLNDVLQIQTKEISCSPVNDEVKRLNETYRIPTKLIRYKNDDIDNIQEYFNKQFSPVNKISQIPKEKMQLRKNLRAEDRIQDTAQTNKLAQLNFMYFIYCHGLFWWEG